MRIYNLSLNRLKIRLLIFLPKFLLLSSKSQIYPPYLTLRYFTFSPTQSQSANPIDSTLEISSKCNSPLHSHCLALARLRHLCSRVLQKPSFLVFTPLETILHTISKITHTSTSNATFVLKKKKNPLLASCCL